MQTCLPAGRPHSLISTGDPYGTPAPGSLWNAAAIPLLRGIIIWNGRRTPLVFYSTPWNDDKKQRNGGATALFTAAIPGNGAVNQGNGGDISGNGAAIIKVF